MNHLDEIMFANQVINDLQEAEDEIEGPGRVFYNRIDAFTLRDECFIKLFRLSKDLTRQVVELVRPFLPEPVRRSAITVETKVRFISMNMVREI